MTVGSQAGSSGARTAIWTTSADAADGVSDEVWANAARGYDGNQLAGLVALIALINTWAA